MESTPPPGCEMGSKDPAFLGLMHFRLGGFDYIDFLLLIFFLYLCWDKAKIIQYKEKMHNNIILLSAYILAHLWHLVLHIAN